VSSATFLFSPSSNLTLDWLEASPFGPIPEGRTNASLAFDSSDEYVVLFGGWTPNGSSVLNDTWRWSPEIGGWSALPTPAGLGGRDGGCMMDVPGEGSSRGYLLLFGGRSNSRLGVPVFPTTTWEYRGGSWANVTASSGSPPPGRSLAACAFDPNVGLGILFGGAGADGQTLNDSWAWNRTTAQWSELSHPQGSGESPSARFGPEASFDQRDGGILLFSGAGGSITRPSPLGADLWLWDGTGWTNLSSSEEYDGLPVFGDWNGAATATSLGFVLFFGGVATNSAYDNGTWAFGDFILASLVPTSNEIVLGDRIGLYVNLTEPTTRGWSVDYQGLPPGCTPTNGSAVICQPAAPGVFSVRAVVTDTSGLTGTTETVPLVVDPKAQVNGTLSDGPEIYQPPATFLGADYWFNWSESPEKLAALVDATGATLQRFYGNWDIGNASAGLTYSSNGVPSTVVPYDLSTYAAFCEDLGGRCHPTITVSAQTNDSGMMVDNLRTMLTYFAHPAFLEIGTEANNWHHFDIPFPAWRPTDNVAPTGLQYALEIRRNAPLLEQLVPGTPIEAQFSAFFSHFPSRVLSYAENLSRLDCGIVSTITLDLYPNVRPSVYPSPQMEMRNLTTLSLALDELRHALFVGNASCSSISVGVSENNVGGGGSVEFPELNSRWSPPFIAAQLIDSLRSSASMYAYWAFIEQATFGSGKGATFTMINATSGGTGRNYPLFVQLSHLGLSSVSSASVTASMQGIYSVAGVGPTGVRSYLVVNTNTTVGLELSIQGIRALGDGMTEYRFELGGTTPEMLAYSNGSVPNFVIVPPGAVVLLSTGTPPQSAGPSIGLTLIVVAGLAAALIAAVAMLSRSSREGPGP
jgi:hypothetical protein